MKKQLLTTTALVAAGMLGFTGVAQAQKKASLAVGGYFNANIGFADNDEGVVGNRTNFDTTVDGEVWFSGKLKLDNGIEIRTRVELENESQADNVDENYLQIRSQWGMLEIGSNDGAAESMTTGYLGTWATAVGQNVAFDTKDWIDPPPGVVYNFQGSFNDQRVRIDTDAEKVSYISPRFAGFQIGGAYVPNTEQDANGSIATTDTVFNNGFQVAANFDRKFDNVRIGIAAGYAELQNPKAIPAPDKSEWMVGGLVEFGPVKFAASYSETNNFPGFDGYGFELGARYSWGPNRVSANYQSGRIEGSTAISGDDKTDTAWLSYARTIAPGSRWHVNLIWAKIEDETGVDNDGFAITTGLVIRF
jgi:predicted porin